MRARKQEPSVGDALLAVGGSIEKIEEVRIDARPCCELAHADGVAAGQRFEREVILAELALDLRQYEGRSRGGGYRGSGGYWALKKLRDRIAGRVAALREVEP